MKHHHVFWIAGGVIFACGIPALASGLYNDSLTFKLIGWAELICGGALVAAGALIRRRHKR